MKAFDRVPLMFGILLLLSFRADAHDPSMAHHEWFNAQGLFACGGGVNSCGCKAQLLLSRLESATRLALGPTSPLVRVEASQTGGRCRSSLLRNRSIQHLLGFVIEIARAISLDLIGDDRKQQMTR